MNDKQRRGQVVVRRVFEATLRSLAEVGYERLSVPECARQAGVNKTSVYRRWPTKADLVRAAVADALEPPPELVDTGSLRGDLLALARRTAAFLESPVGRGLLRVLVAEGEHPELRELTRLPASRLGGRGAAALVERAVARGELPGPQGQELVLFTLAGALMHRLLVERQPTNEPLLERLVDLVVSGCLASGAGEPGGGEPPTGD